MQRTLRAILMAVGLTTLASASTAQGPVVVELFTSQGCSNCPPVDELLGELAQHEDVIALALHVDYWDYIGWADTFANPAFTARQHGYARAAGSTVVYTPQLVIGGEAQMIGHQPMAVFGEIVAHVEAPDPVVLELTRVGEGFVLHAQMQGPAPDGVMLIHLVRYTPFEVVDIRRGENANQALEYHNIVRDWQVVAEWDGRDEITVDLPQNGSEPHVVIVQEATHGPILAAARLE